MDFVLETDQINYFWWSIKSNNDNIGDNKRVVEREMGKKTSFPFNELQFGCQFECSTNYQEEEV